MANTVGGIIRGAMRKICVLAAGEPLQYDEGQDALEVFRQMVDAWSNKRLTVPTVNLIEKAMVPNESEYTIGIYPDPKPDPLPDNHIETTRPIEFITHIIRDVSGTDFPLDILDSRQYSERRRKFESARPYGFYLRKGWPLHTIIFTSVPYTDDTLFLEVLQPLSKILPLSKLDDAINLPPGYEKALVYNLAIDLADEWGKTPSQTVAFNAADSLKKVKRANTKVSYLQVDRALRRNIYRKGAYCVESGP